MRASRRSAVKNSDWNCVTSSPASSRLSSSSASACRVTTTLTRYSAVPIDSTASSALARKIRFESDDSMPVFSPALLRRRRGGYGQVDLDVAAVGHGHLAALRLDRLVPQHECVGAGRHAVDAIAADAVGDGEVRMREDEDERAHVG